MIYRILVSVLLGAFLVGGCSKESRNPRQEVRKLMYPEEDAKQVVDLSGFYRDRIKRDGKGFSGRKIYDGVTFHIDGRIVLYGRSQANWDDRGKPNGSSERRYPDKTGIPVDRAFEELHLLHATYWPDVQGEIVAYIRLHYADHSKYEFPIYYGGHVRDNQRIRTEESELMSDRSTKVVWRGPGSESFKSTGRAFKSTLINPFPKKVVKTMDVVSARHLASYQLYAASVANSDPGRTNTPPVPSGEPERVFDGAVKIRVVNEAGDPIEGALVRPYMDTDGPYMVAAPFYTSEKGEGIIGYPKGRTAHMSLGAEMKGYSSAHANWSGEFPESHTFTLTRMGEVEARSAKR